MDEIFQIKKPGTFLKTEIHPEDRHKNIKKFEAEIKKNWHITTTLSYLMDSYYEANISLNLFDKAVYELEECHKSIFRGKSHSNIPREFHERMPYIYAKTFIYSLDTYKWHLNHVLGLNQQNKGIQKAFEDFKNAFPDLKFVRDSAHHLEQRVQGKSNKGKIDVKPFPNGEFGNHSGSMNHVRGIIGDSHMLVTESLSGNVFGLTDQEGGYSKVAISNESMLELQKITQLVYDSLDWQSSTYNEYLPNVNRWYLKNSCQQRV